MPKISKASAARSSNVGTSSLESKVAFVSHTAQPGGAELALARYLKSTHLKYCLIALQDGPIWNEVNTGGDPVDEVGTEIGVLTTIKNLRSRLAETKPNVIVANSMRAAFYCAILKPRGSKLVYWVRDGLRESSMSKVNLWLTTKITMPRVDKCIANSAWTAETIRAVNSRMPVSVIPSPCGLMDEEFIESRKQFLVSNHVALLYLGRLSRWKGVHHAISALAGLVRQEDGIDYHLTIAGAALFEEQDYEHELRKLVVDLGLEQYVNFAGHVDNVRSLLAKHDVLLHCSIVPEPFGQVIIQALAAGVGVVAADAGGPKEIIESGVHGLLYEPGNEHALQGAVQQIAHEGILPTLSANAIVRSKNYTDQSLVQRLDGALSKLIKEVVTGVES